MFLSKKIYLSFLAFSALALSACSLDPDVEITQKNVKEAMNSLSKNEVAKVTALGGDKYLVGKTLNKLKLGLARDYQNFEINQLAEHAKINRAFNLELASKGELSSESVRSDFAESPEEKAIEISELSLQDHYLRTLRTELKRPLPLGSGLLDKGVLTCRKKENLIALDQLERSDITAFKKEKTRKLKRKECHEMKRAAMLTLREIGEGLGGKTIFRTARGWVYAKDLKDRTSKEELEKLREEAQSKLNSLKENPAPQFYSVFRPLIEISPKNPSRIKLAEKAILLNMEKYKETWEQASQRFVNEQKEFARSEYQCKFENNCSKNQSYNLRMASYILAETPKNMKAGRLPCSISQVQACKKTE